MSPQGAELTKLALDYLKPDSEETKASALAEAMYSFPTYVELIEKHVGKKTWSGTWIQQLQIKMAEEAAAAGQLGCRGQPAAGAKLELEQTGE